MTWWSIQASAGTARKTVYSLISVPYYYGLPMYPADENGNQLTTEVTLNASA